VAVQGHAPLQGQSRFISPFELCPTDREKTPTRLDSQETRVNVEEDFQPRSVLGRFSFNQASLPDNSYNPVRALMSRIPTFGLIIVSIGASAVCSCNSDT